MQYKTSKHALLLWVRTGHLLRGSLVCRCWPVGAEFSAIFHIHNNDIYVNDAISTVQVIRSRLRKGIDCVWVNSGRSDREISHLPITRVYNVFGFAAHIFRNMCHWQKQQCILMSAVVNSFLKSCVYRLLCLRNTHWHGGLILTQKSNSWDRQFYVIQQDIIICFNTATLASQLKIHWPRQWVKSWKLKWR
jgi:hypothetical protein